MFGLQKSFEVYKAACGDTNVDRDMLDDVIGDVTAAVREHIKGSHITITYEDGSVGRREVRWDAGEQRFVDWGNNFWLYGPKSFRGERAGGKWVLEARHDTEVIAKAILDRAEQASKFNRVDRLWNFYWQLMLQDTLRYSEGETIDLHVTPLDVNALESKPKPMNFDKGFHRTRDIICV